MLFHHLFPDILDMTDDSYAGYSFAYREKRQQDLESEVIKVKTKRKKGATRSSERKIAVTPDALKLLRAVGLI